MGPWAGTAWNRLASLGIGEQPPGEQRRIRLANQSAMLAILTCSTFAVAYALAGPRYAHPMIANLVAVAGQVVALVLSARGSHTLARFALIVPINLVVMVASIHLGVRVGFLYYYVVFAALGFLVFPENRRSFGVGLMALSAGCCIASMALAPELAKVCIVIPERIALAVDATSAVAVLATISFVVHLFTRDTALAEARLAEEHARSERLLRNILPASVIARLKAHDTHVAGGFPGVTVLFADLVGFTELAARLDPAALVELLNRVFSAFDDLAEEHGVEKIKTIGDCYMAAAGVPEPREDHAAAAARLALAMQRSLGRINAEAGQSLVLRIGLHSGPVVAGVIGKRKYTYDLWGDAVNTASRMESHGVPGAIQVSRATADLLGPGFALEPRGAIHLKGKGDLEAFLLRGETEG